ncbi:hypothetical protein ACXYTP_05125 [Tsukamurella ocularis]|uniref:hypothetical protein n=1 Tax=Tsukamurella ocularis TaxID=1970234 RepID=UPI0039F10D14
MLDAQDAINEEARTGPTIETVERIRRGVVGGYCALDFFRSAAGRPTADEVMSPAQWKQLFESAVPFRAHEDVSEDEAGNLRYSLSVEDLPIWNSGEVVYRSAPKERAEGYSWTKSFSGALSIKGEGHLWVATIPNPWFERFVDGEHYEVVGIPKGVRRYSHYVIEQKTGVRLDP